MNWWPAKNSGSSLAVPCGQNEYAAPSSVSISPTVTTSAVPVDAP